MKKSIDKYFYFLINLSKLTLAFFYHQKCFRLNALQMDGTVLIYIQMLGKVGAKGIFSISYLKNKWLKYFGINLIV